ncbi:hypothetical protein [Aeromicrobium sp.]
MLIFTIALLVIASGIALAVLIPRDGYGSRPGPPSHADFSPHLN